MCRQNQVAANDSITMFTTEMDARIVKVQQELGESDAEISRPLMRVRIYTVSID